MSTRHKGIIAYGQDIDRQKLAALAVASGRSGSEVIIAMIREKFDDTFGDTDPNVIISIHTR